MKKGKKTMLNYIKEEWLRLILIAMYIVIIVYCAIVGNVLAVVGWGTGAVILMIGSIVSHCFYKAAAKCVDDGSSKVVIEIHND